MADITIVTRDFIPTDEAFIYSTWLKSYKASSSFARWIRYDTFFPNHQEKIRRILEGEGTVIRVAHPRGLPQTIYGYLVYEQITGMPRPVLHFVYVRLSERRKRIAAQLFFDINLNPSHCEYTHRTKECVWIEKMFPQLNYNPYLAL